MSTEKHEVNGGQEDPETTEDAERRCPDIWAELRDLRDMAVEQRVELRNQETRLNAAEELVGQLTRDNQDMGARLTVTEDLVTELQKELAGKPKVAFSAALGIQGTMGPLSSDITVPFNTVYANIGEAFSSKTGVFTAKVKGVHHFTITGFGRGTDAMILGLYKESQLIISAYHARSTDYYTNMSNSVSLPLEVGEEVSVKLRAGAVIYDDHDIVTTVSGHLLFPL